MMFQRMLLTLFCGVSLFGNVRSRPKGTIIVLHQTPTRSYAEPSEINCCRLGEEMANLGYRQCSDERHSLSILDQLYAPGLAPARLVEKCQYLFYNDLSSCCEQTLKKKDLDFKNLILKTRKSINKLREALSRF